MGKIRASRRELNLGNIPVGHFELSENQDDQGWYTGYFDLDSYHPPQGNVFHSSEEFTRMLFGCNAIDYSFKIDQDNQTSP